jgi:hypothetical protein
MSMTEIEVINGWTFEETIQTTENLMEVENNVFKWDVLRHLRDFAESFKDELEQYRAIGTVEGYKRAVKVSKENYYLCAEYKARLKEYEAIGTIDEFKALKEKNEPKKAIGKRKYDEAYCPACNEVISDGEFWALDEYVHHCNYCGQAVKGVDWQ